MPETSNSQDLRFHCPVDRKDFQVPRAKKIECPDGHQLSYDFPKHPYWNYCCTCDVFSLAETSEEVKSEDQLKCRTCERPIARRFLCDKCKMITIETSEIKKPGSFALNSHGAPIPNCPGCLKPAAEKLYKHSCSTASFHYSTARANCPFCNEDIGPQPGKQEAIFPEVDVLGQQHGLGSQSTPAKRNSTSNEGPSFLPAEVSSHLGLIVGVVSFILTVIGLMVVFLPSVWTFASWRWGKLRNHAPLVQAIDCAQSVKAGRQLRLRAHANDADRERLTFAWTISYPSKAGRIEIASHSGDEAVFYPEGIYPLADPVKVIIQLVVSDNYENVPAPEREIWVLPYQNHPPEIELFECNCEKYEVRAGGSISLRAFATDKDAEDNDNLIYNWKSSLPAILITTVNSKYGSTAILNTAGINPESRGTEFKVTLTVSDGQSRAELREHSIIVLPKEVSKNSGESAPPVQQINHPPRFEKFTVSKNLVEEGESVELRALVIDPDGSSPLFYKWTTSAGTIQPNDDTATLNTSGVSASEVEVTLTVNDSHGPPTALRTSITVKPRSVKAPLPSPNPSPTSASTPLLLFSRTAIGQLGRLGGHFFVNFLDEHK